jgi:tetratricopeptide (TPR) repeat protein
MGKGKPVYRVNVTLAEEEDRFRITWFEVETSRQDVFETPAQDFTSGRVYVKTLWKSEKHALETGGKIFRLLNGDAKHLDKALEKARHSGIPMQLFLSICPEAADWPFELLAKGGDFLLTRQVHLVRSVSDWGESQEYSAQARPLKLLFMACSAVDVNPELDFEKEEETIFQVTENLAVDMEVEDSGSLEGLRYQLEQEECDVVHLSGHVNIDKERRPFFIMEDETGAPQEVSSYRLWNDALIENSPRLLFVSGCNIGEVTDTDAAVSFAKELVKNHHIPVVLGWDRPVSDEQSILASKMIYHELSRGKTILEAVQRARYELITHFPSNPNPAWSLLRLFSSGESLEAIVKKGQKNRPKARRMKHIYLKQSQIQVLAEGFVGRRRQLQQSLRTLRHNHDKIGVLLYGTGGLGKSCLAGKICERFIDHTLIIVHGKLNAITLNRALKDAFKTAQDETGEMILATKAEIGEKLGRLFTTSFQQHNYLLVFDDFEQNLEGADQGKPGPLLLEAAQLLSVLLNYLPFSGKMTQIIITSRYTFSLTKYDRDMVKERLELVCLTSFQPAEQRKKARELRNILNYPEPSLVPWLLAAGQGNPRLMEWLNILVGQMPEPEVTQLLEAVKDKQEEFIRSHVIQELLQRGGEELTRLLCWFSIYRKPVLIEGVMQVGEKVGVKKWKELLNQGVKLSLVEHDHTRNSYTVTPLLQKELLSSLDDCHIRSCHHAAFNYYKGICEPMEQIDPLLMEELIYHSLSCGEEAKASKQGGILVSNLRERLAFQESRRVGEWILKEKDKEISTKSDAFLLNALAYTIDDLGDHRKAIEYYKQALVILIEAYGEQHPQVATVLNNLGSSWYSLGDHRKAIAYYEQALAIDETVFGRDNPNVAIRLNNLGSIWKTLGDYRKAVGYYGQALSILKEVYGENHPQVATGLNNLGLAWNSLGDYGKAITYYDRALVIWKEVFSERHPQVAAVLNNLGSAWDSLDDHRKAIAYYEQGLDILHEVYGENHPQVATGLNNLGSAYFKMGQKGKAKGYFEKAYAIFNKRFGEQHPNTMTVKEWLKVCT